LRADDLNCDWPTAASSLEFGVLELRQSGEQLEENIPDHRKERHTYYAGLPKDSWYIRRCPIPIASAVAGQFQQGQLTIERRRIKKTKKCLQVDRRSQSAVKTFTLKQ
jgi:hypothetical protein